MQLTKKEELNEALAEYGFNYINHDPIFQMVGVEERSNRGESISIILGEFQRAFEKLESDDEGMNLQQEKIMEQLLDDTADEILAA